MGGGWARAGCSDPMAEGSRVGYSNFMPEAAREGCPSTMAEGASAEASAGSLPAHDGATVESGEWDGGEGPVCEGTPTCPRPGSGAPGESSESAELAPVCRSTGSSAGPKVSESDGLNDRGPCVKLLTESVNGQRLVFANDVEVDPSAGTRGVVYFTESSRKYQRRDFMFATMEGRAEGRLLMHDIGSGRTTVLQDNLVFPNGVALSHNKSFLAFCESTAMRCTPLCTFSSCWVALGAFPGILRAHSGRNLRFLSLNANGAVHTQELPVCASLSSQCDTAFALLSRCAVCLASFCKRMSEPC